MSATREIPLLPERATAVRRIVTARDLMKEFRELDTDRTADSFYTNEFLPER